MNVTDKMNARRKFVLEMLKSRPHTGQEIAIALGYAPKGGVTHVMAPLIADGLVTSRREKNAIIYQIKPKAPQKHAVPVRHIMVPRHRGSTHENPEMVRVTLPAAPWEVRA